MYFDENNNHFNMLVDEDSFDIDKYINKTKYNNISVGNIVFNRHSDMPTNPVEGFNRGNMFDSIYNGYKKHSYSLKVNNKRDELLYKIQIYNFAIRDLGLYLDLHPTETNILKLYIDYNKELSKLKKVYNDTYSPLNMNEMTNDTKWTWINNPWPWDKGGNI